MPETETNLKVIRIDAGTYPVGDDSIPDARPRHQRLIDRPFWIEIGATPVDVFARFVCRGGYSRPELWPDRCPAVPISVDQRCELVRQHSGPIGRLARPVVGLTQLEATAVARFAGARLPFESEWEIAATRTMGKIQVFDDLLEWTADVFSPVYWRADFRRRGVEWTGAQAGALVSVRGFTPEALVKHASARRGADPLLALPKGTFRRVWDERPVAAEEV